MKIKEQIANFFTLMNLACGVTGIAFLSVSGLTYACGFMLLGMVFDFLDGFVARALGITSDIGKQLDSLSDLVTFGVLPGFIAVYLLLDGFNNEISIILGVALLIPLFSALRLAKFNIDTRQTSNFIGVPTPANALLWASFGLGRTGEAKVGFLHDSLDIFFLQLIQNPTFIVICIIVTSLLLVSPLNLFAFKFDKFRWQGNELKFSLLVISVLLFVIIGVVAIPIILLLYIIFSIIHFYILKKT